MGLFGKLIGTAALVVGAAIATKKIKDNIDTKNAEKKADKLALESKDSKYIKVNDIVEEYIGENYIKTQKAQSSVSAELAEPFGMHIQGICLKGAAAENAAI